MTKHPCMGLGKGYWEAFEQIATGNPLPPMRKNMIDKMLAKGLIERGPNKPMRDGIGVFSIPQYFVPTRIHMQWRQWCSEQKT